MTHTLPKKIRKLNDNRWLKMVIASLDNPVIKGVAFPRFPPDDWQSRTTGSSNEQTLNEAFVFYQLLKNESARFSNPLSLDSHFLDFGCGWGRFLRFLWKDIGSGNLFGCDVSNKMVDTCHSLDVPGKIDRIDPLGCLPYEDDFFSHVMAYSVFTHLPEAVHLHWMTEIARVMKPGGTFCLTLEPRRFLDFIATITDAPDQHFWYRQLSKHKPNLQKFFESFDSGNLVFLPTKEGLENTYGDAVVPLSFILEKWQPWFEVREYVDERERFWQSALVVQRTEYSV